MASRQSARLPVTVLSGFLGAAFRSHPFTLLWYAGLRAPWILLGRLGFNWKYKHS